jgi:hypothetical protein
VFLARPGIFVKVTDRKREFVVRFAVGDARGHRSSVWRIWKGRNKDDIYIAPRPMVSKLKGSLHESGFCYFSVTTEHHKQMMAAGTAREKRGLTRWKRLPTPAAGMVSAVCILFAAEFLQRNFTPVVEQETTLIPIPKSGETVIVDLVFARMPDGRLLLLPHQRQLGHVMLSSGEEFLIVATLVNDFDAQEFRRLYQPSSESCEVAYLQETPRGDPDRLRGAILVPALNDGVLRIVEIGPAFITQFRTP